MTNSDISSHAHDNAGPTYAGFWVRTVAHTVDAILFAVLFGVIVTLVLGAIYGDRYFDEYFSVERPLYYGPLDAFLSLVLPCAATIMFWVYEQATPGKMLVKAKIVDAQTGGKPSTGQCIGRYFAYFVSVISLGLGFIWIAFDKRKQGWHDKLAGTVVVRRPEPVSFNQEN